MSCCGTPRNEQKDQSNRPVQATNSYSVNQQPLASPTLSSPSGIQREKSFQVHAPSPPPQTHSYGGNASNGYGQLAPWQQPQAISTPPPQSPHFNQYSPGASGNYNPNNFGAGANVISVERPPPTHGNSMSNGAPVTRGGLLADDGKLVVSVDFGTTLSGVAYGSSRIAGGAVQQVINWPNTQETYRKIPTCLLYDDHGRVLAWGLEAKNSGTIAGTFKCEWFKMYLDPAALREGSNRLPPLPPGKRAFDLIVDFLSCLWEYAKEQITRAIGAVADLNAADVWLTVPAAWDAAGCGQMREAAIQAGLVQSSRAGDFDWRERLRIITEPEAAAVHCVFLTELHKLKNNQTFMICDAGGGTVDLAIYRVIGKLENLEIAEVCARSGSNCGSIYLDLRFRDLVGSLLADHPQHLDAESLANFMHAFSEGEKLDFAGDDHQQFAFTCFNPEDPHDSSVGLRNGELYIPGSLLRREVFDPVVKEVLRLIESQAAKVSQPIDALLMVGGFSGSEYLFSKVNETFGNRIRVIARPDDADTATLRGSARYGLARRPLVSSVIAPRSYIMKVKLPAENIDFTMRPAYIRENDAGVQVCENRLQYLVTKGAILRKGQRLKTPFCKFSANASDRTFVADLYSSDSDKVMRYTDEGEMQELCKWTVNLGTLPTFIQYSQLPHPNGFYTDFELGLELDSAEVRGVLLHQGQEWGRVIFDFLV